MAAELLYQYPLASVSSSEHLSAKLVLGDFYKEVEFMAECSRRERHLTRPTMESMDGAHGIIRFHGTTVENQGCKYTQ